MSWYKIIFTQDQLQNNEEWAFLQRFIALQLHPSRPKHLVLFRPVSEEQYPISSIIYLPPNAHPYLGELLAGFEQCDQPDKASVHVDAGDEADFRFWFA